MQEPSRMHTTNLLVCEACDAAIVSGAMPFPRLEGEKEQTA